MCDSRCVCQKTQSILCVCTSICVFVSMPACNHVSVSLCLKGDCFDSIPVTWPRPVERRLSRFLWGVWRKVFKIAFGEQFPLGKALFRAVGKRSGVCAGVKQHGCVVSLQWSGQAITWSLLTHYPQGADVQADLVEESVSRCRVIVPAVTVLPSAAIIRALKRVQQPRR